MSIEPVRKQIVVNALPEHAFEVFTRGIDRWWPREHHIGASPLKQAIIEPRSGGRWYSVCMDGSECDVGKVTVWDPPRRLGLTWQINADWQYDPAFVTNIELTFTAEGSRKTLVVLEHRDLHRFGIKAGATRDMLDSAGGWGSTLSLFAAEAEKAA